MRPQFAEAGTSRLPDDAVALSLPTRAFRISLAQLPFTPGAYEGRAHAERNPDNAGASSPPPASELDRAKPRRFG